MLAIKLSTNFTKLSLVRKCYGFFMLLEALLETVFYFLLSHLRIFLPQ